MIIQKGSLVKVRIEAGLWDEVYEFLYNAPIESCWSESLNGILITETVFRIAVLNSEIDYAHDAVAIAVLTNIMFSIQDKDSSTPILINLIEKENG